MMRRMIRCSGVRGILKPASVCSTASINYSPVWKRRPPRSSTTYNNLSRLIRSVGLFSYQQVRLLFRRAFFLLYAAGGGGGPAQYAVILLPNDAVAFAGDLLQELTVPDEDATAFVVDGADSLQRA